MCDAHIAVMLWVRDLYDIEASVFGVDSNELGQGPSHRTPATTVCSLSPKVIGSLYASTSIYDINNLLQKSCENLIHIHNYS